MYQHGLRTFLLTTVAFFGLLLITAQGQEPKPPIGFEALLGFDQLPLLVDWPAYQDSSYHRQNINQDAGNFLRVEPNGDQVLMDTDGPGVVYRLWSTGVVGMQMSPQCRLKFFFDGESRPRLDLSMSELFGDKGSRWPFVPPLSVTFESGSGGGEGPCNLCYVPIPFARHLKIVGRNVMFYHVNYHKLPPATRLESFSYGLAEKHRPTLEKAAAFWQEVGQRPGQRQGQQWQSWQNLTLAPNQEWRAPLEGPGAISTLAVQLAQPTPRVLRGVSLEIAFEDDNQVCVRTPLGDFFGTGCGDRRFKSLPTGMTDEGYYAYWPMPFRKSAVVRLRNDLSEPVVFRSLKIGTLLGPQPASAGYFHARYVENHDIPIGEDYRILEAAGRGKLVGANVTMQNARGGTGIFYLEGDEKIYVDGEKWPSRWLGTGTEDYFNGAYFWNAPNKAAMARPQGGLTFLDWGIGRVCAYRWHILDFISFRKNVRLDLEHGGVSDSPADYQSVAYYYLERPTAQPPLPSLASRLPKTQLPPAPRWLCCDLSGLSDRDGRPLITKKFSEVSNEWASQDTVFTSRAQAGQALRLIFQVPGEDDFTPVLFLTGGPDHGTWEVTLDGRPAGRINTFRPQPEPWVAAEFSKQRLARGEHRLVLTLAQDPPGQSGSQKTDRAIGVVALQLRPHSRFIDQWSLVGNFPCPKDTGWKPEHEPERNQDLGAKYRLADGRTLSWREYRQPYVGLAGGDWLVAYGLTYIHSPDDRTVAFFLAKDDGLKIWVNDKVVFDQNTWSHGYTDQFFCSARLKKGWNKVLVKCANWNGAWGFALRPGDPRNQLRFARQPD